MVIVTHRFAEHSQRHASGPSFAKRLGLVMMEVGHACRLVGLKRDRRTYNLIEDDVETMWLALVSPYLNLD